MSAYAIENKEMCTNEKVKHLPVPVWHVVKSFEVVMIPLLILKTHVHVDYL